MIRKVVELDTDLVDQAAELILRNDAYRRYCFPTCEDTKQIATALRKLTSDWRSVVQDRVLAVFSIDKSNKRLSNMCIKPGAVELVVSEILSVLSVTEANSPLELGDVWIRHGFQKGVTQVQFVRTPQESSIMQLLPLTNPTLSDLQAISRLMVEVYSGKYVDAKDAERHLRNLMNTKDFLNDCSFISKARDQVVSACLVSGSSVRAEVVELLTHPLYRARRLAYTELSMAMNRLLKRRVAQLWATVDSENKVAVRLFSKHGFTEAARTVAMKNESRRV
jgi:ribosomal protein S18 acetylase RimI-like enzyme